MTRWFLLVLVALVAAEDVDRRCVCKPSMNVAYGESPQVCNNATFTWLLGTVLEQVTKQSEGLEAQRHELVVAQDLAKECQGQIASVLRDLEDERKVAEELKGERENLKIQNAALVEEIEQLKTQQAHVHIRPKDCADVLRSVLLYTITDVQ
jgi:hypothetical protein